MGRNYNAVSMDGFYKAAQFGRLIGVSDKVVWRLIKQGYLQREPLTETLWWTRISKADAAAYFQKYGMKAARKKILRPPPHSPPKFTIEDVQRVAAERGGRCLSDTYRVATDKIRWECAAGHIWTASFAAVKHKHWCRICAYKTLWDKRGRGKKKVKRKSTRTWSIPLDICEREGS